MYKSAVLYGIMNFIVLANEVVCHKNSHGVVKQTFCNPKYYSVCIVTSYKQIINEEERSFCNLTFTHSQTLTNNITISSILTSSSGIRLTFKNQLCDFFKQPWMVSFLKVKQVKCPFEAGSTLEAYGLEVPPKTTAIPLKPGVYVLDAELAHKESILKLNLKYHIVSQKKSNKKG